MHAAFVVEAELALDEGFDPAAVGAAVTTDLCGHWEHDGPCRWPTTARSRQIATRRRSARCSWPTRRRPQQVRQRVEAVLGDGSGWRLVSLRERAVADAERPLAERLLSGPRAG
jgi:hypothetical protein